MVVIAPVVADNLGRDLRDLRDVFVVIDRQRNRQLLVREIGNVHRTGHDDLRRLRNIIIVDMPVGVIGVLVEHQRQFVVRIALGVEIVLHVTPQHTAVGDVAVGGVVDRTVDVVAFDLEESAVEHIVFVRALIQMLVGMLSLHILVEEQRRSVLGMVSEGVHAAAARKFRPLRVVGTLSVKDHIAFGNQFIG